MEYNADSHSLKCPKCHHGMEEVVHGDVTIDRCSHCKGIWFDLDEAYQLKGIDPKQKHIWFEACAEHGMFMDAGEFKDFKEESVLDFFRSLIKGRRDVVAP